MNIYMAADMKWQPNLASDTTVSITHNLDNLTAALQDNLQTPTAIKELRAIMLAYVEDGVQDAAKQDFQLILEKFDNLLGLKLANRADINDEQKELIQKREVAKQNKDFAIADSIRHQLKQQSIGLEDRANGTRWYRI
jgi:cysteinyl-tRNA synthetase